MNDKLLLKPKVVWALLTLLYFSVGATHQGVSAIIPSLFMSSSQFFTYIIINKKLIPRYFDINRSKFHKYNLLIIVIIAIFMTLVFRFYFIIFPPSQPVTKANIFGPFFLNLIVCSFASWASISGYLLDKEKKTIALIEDLKRDKIESELRFLKMQINPHFLFNALNNIYSLAYSEDKRVPEKIAMLSEMLRYVLYDCETEYISLGMEIRYIQNFIDFQQMKTENPQNITLTNNNYQADKRISPMLFAPLVENAFKHSKIEEDPLGFVHISITTAKQKILFEVKNSIPANPRIPSQLNRGKGIGIDNIKNRLKFLYPQKHELIIDNNQTHFTVKLELYD